MAVHDVDNVRSPLQTHAKGKVLAPLLGCWKSAVCLSIGIMACIVHVLVGRMCFSLPLLCFCSAVMSRHGLSPFSSRLLQHNEFVVYVCISSSGTPFIPSGYRDHYYVHYYTACSAIQEKMFSRMTRAAFPKKHHKSKYIVDPLPPMELRST